MEEGRSTFKMLTGKPTGKPWGLVNIYPRANGLLGGTTFCPYDGKLSLKSDEPQVGQRPEDVVRKREYFHISIFH
jgi:hypothetical protein